MSRRGRIEGKEREGGVVGEGWLVRGCAHHSRMSKGSITRLSGKGRPKPHDHWM